MFLWKMQKYINSFVFNFCLPFILTCLDKNTFAAVRDTMIYIKIMLNFVVDLPFMCCFNASLFKFKTKQNPTNLLLERKVKIFTLFEPLCITVCYRDLFCNNVFYLHNKRWKVQAFARLG